MATISKTQPAQTYWRRTLAILFTAQMFTAVGFSSIVPFLPFYVADLGTNTGLSVEFLSGLVFSVQAFAMMIASPFWGALADRYGRKMMVERAMFGGAFTLLVMAFAQSAEQLVLLRGIQGLITGTIAASNALVASVVPRRRTGYAMGVLQVGLGAGVALGPLIGGAIADAFGYSAAFYMTAALLFSAGVLVWWGVRENFTPIQDVESRNISFIEEWRHVLNTAGIPTAYAMRFLSQLGRMMILPIAPLFIQTLMTNTSRLNTFTGLVVGVASATTTLSALFFGRLSDRIGHRRIVITSSAFAALFYFLQSGVASGWQLLFLQALVGIAMGGIIPTISALLADLTQTDEAGAVFGLDNSIISGGRSMAPLIGSAVAMAFNLRATFVATAVFFLITALLAAWRLPQVIKTQQVSPAD